MYADNVYELWVYVGPATELATAVRGWTGDRGKMNCHVGLAEVPRWPIFLREQGRVAQSNPVKLLSLPGLLPPSRLLALRTPVNSTTWLYPLPTSRYGPIPTSLAHLLTFLGAKQRRHELEGAPDPFPSLAQPADAQTRARQAPAAASLDTESEEAFPSLAAAPTPSSTTATSRPAASGWGAGPRLKAAVSKAPVFTDSFTLGAIDLSNSGKNGKPATLGEVIKQVMAKYKVKVEASANQRTSQTTFHLKAESEKDLDKAKRSILALVSPVVSSRVCFRLYPCTHMAIRSLSLLTRRLLLFRLSSVPKVCIHSSQCRALPGVCLAFRTRKIARANPDISYPRQITLLSPPPLLTQSRDHSLTLPAPRCYPQANPRSNQRARRHPQKGRDRRS